MVKQINPALARLYSADLVRTYGTKNPIALPVSSVPQQLALEMLEEGVADNQMTQLGKITGASEREINDLVDWVPCYQAQVPWGQSLPSGTSTNDLQS
ncbi:MAG: hypothetical protein EBS38_05165 [Actinobacteria bacterium]|nr:hypothetical protein [Actinomycetota bacterium]